MKKILILIVGAAAGLAIGIAAGVMLSHGRSSSAGSSASESAAAESFAAESAAAESLNESSVSAASSAVQDASSAASAVSLPAAVSAAAVPASSPLLCDSSSLYTYSEMEADLHTLADEYGDISALDSIGQTADGRELYHLLIGNKDASAQILIFASIHAREYISTQLVMKQCEEFLSDYKTDASYHGVPVSQLMQDKAIHFIPMADPDGVTISQLGIDGLKNDAVKENVKKIAAMDGESGALYFQQWKSNAQGIDLNRNFDAEWESYDDQVGHPSSDHYKGTAPECAPEAAALVKLTESYPFVRTVNYHTQGDVIYWYFGQTGSLKTVTETFAQQMADLTGYTLDADYQNLDPAGYKDWAISKKGIPSITIETGSGTSPVPNDQLDSIWAQNESVWYGILEGI